MLSVGIGLTVASSLGWVTADVMRKQLASNLPPLLLAVRLALYQALLMLIAVPVILSVPSLGVWSEWTLMPSYWLAALPTFLCTALGHITFLRSIQLSELGLTIPYLSFSPIFVMTFAAIFLEETPSTMGLIGIIIVVLGAFLLNPNQGSAIKSAGLSSNVRIGALLMLITAMLWSAGAAFDKVALRHSSPLAHLTLLLWISFFILATTNLFVGQREHTGTTLSQRPALIACAVMLISLGLQLAAYAHWDVAYVETVKRAIGLVGSVTLGALVFKERGLKRRLVAVGVMTFGTAVLILGQ